MMQIELSQETEERIRALLSAGTYESADEVVDVAVEFLEVYRPAMESLEAKLREAHAAFEAGKVGPLEVDDVKHQGRNLRAKREVAS